VRPSRLILVTLTMLALPLAARAGKNPTGHDVARGAINIVLANKNGIVVLTDSMITAGSRQLPEPGQKLFKLDDRTVCTIAGFVGASGPVPDLYTSTSAIIHEYVAQSAGQSAQSIHEKLSVLAQLFEGDLSGIANLRAETGMAQPMDNYAFELTIAGYDVDGTPRIGQIVLNTVPFHGLLSSEIQDVSITDVKKEFMYKLAGEPDIAERLLHDPGSAKNDSVLRTYEASLRRDQGESLTIVQMKEIASRLARYTAQSYPSVGGANQVAILQAGHVTNIEQATFIQPPRAPIRFSLMVDARVSGPHSMEIGPGVAVVFLRTAFERDRRPLDGHYFLSNAFTDSLLIYNGGPLSFDKSNQLTDCQLLLGARVTLGDPKVRHLLNDFQWTKGVYQEVRAPQL
jgi:hypothetical protein